MINQEHPEQISTIIPAMRNLKTLPFFGVIYLVLNDVFPISYIASEEYVNHPWGMAFQLAYLVPTFIGFRWRFYIGWLLAESSCMTLGLGAYPFQTDPKAGLGPTKSVPEENGIVNKGTASEQNDEPHRDTHRYSNMYRYIKPSGIMIKRICAPFGLIHNSLIPQFDFGSIFCTPFPECPQ